jgi:hypothetical protein
MTIGHMRSWTVAALSLLVASLGLGTYLAALEVAEGSLSHGPSAVGEWRVRAYAVRDELGRPACRRNNFSDRLARIGPNCP